MSRSPDDIDALLREAYRSVPVAEPDLEGRIIRNAIGTQEERAGGRELTGPALSAVDEASPAHAVTAALPGRLGRWALRLYWLAAGIVSVALIARAGVADPGPFVLAIAAGGALPLWLAMRALARSSGGTTASLIARTL